MTKALENRNICFIKAVLLLFEHEQFLLNFASHGLSCPPPQAQLGLNACQHLSFCTVFCLKRISFYYYTYELKSQKVKGARKKKSGIEMKPNILRTHWPQ